MGWVPPTPVAASVADTPDPGVLGCGAVPGGIGSPFQPRRVRYALIAFGTMLLVSIVLILHSRALGPDLRRSGLCHRCVTAGGGCSGVFGHIGSLYQYRYRCMLVHGCSVTMRQTDQVPC